MKILLATNNKNKAKEFKSIFEKMPSPLCGFDVVTLSDIGYTDEIVEDGTTFEENSEIKARTGAKLGYICIADDSGLSVDYLGGKPGIYSARYSGEAHNDKANIKKLLSELSDVPKNDRGAKFVCVISCVFPDGRSFSVRGECHGIIADREYGDGGFGYDPVFYVPEYGRTFAELTPEEKNMISHRGRAVKLFADKFPEYITSTSEKQN